MNVIHNIEPSSFLCEEKNLKVYDERKKIFYVHPNTEKSILFNLPKGKFFTPNRIFREKKFIPYKTFVSAVDSSQIKGIKVIIRKNPNKATVYRSIKTIVIDNEFANHDFKPVPVFVFAHELHHFTFFPKNEEERKNDLFMLEIEKKCDEGAVNYMLGNGYNPSQIKLAKEIVLSNKHRGKCVDDLTTNKNNNYRR